MRNKNYIIINKRRFFTFIVLIFILTLVLITNILDLQAEASDPIEYKEVQIKSGDTLWDIANKENKYNIDIREYIYILRDINDLESPNLQPGQILQIPSFEKTN